MQIREAEDADLERLGEIFTAAWEHLHERYAPRRPGPGDPGERVPFLRHLRRTGLLVVADDPEPVGFAAAMLREDLWFLSQLWVLPEAHGRGIGSALFDEALSFGRDAQVFATVSSPHPAAQLLYLRASMLPQWSTIDMGGGRGDRPDQPDGVRDLTDADQGWVDELDREVRGVARPEDHVFWRGEEGAALALERVGEPAGYVYVWPDGKVAPGAVREVADVPVLVRAALHAAGERATFHVPSTGWRALTELVRLGLVPLGSSTTFMASRPVADGTRSFPTGALG